MEDFWLFVSLGVLGSAGPAHFGFRILAHRQHLDRGYAFAPSCQAGQWHYSLWLMKFKHTTLNDPALNFFAHVAGVAGWLASVSAVSSAIFIFMKL